MCFDLGARGISFAGLRMPPEFFVDTDILCVQRMKYKLDFVNIELYELY